MAEVKKEFWAHISRDDGRPQSLLEHLTNTAELARKFADVFGGGDLAYLAGLWHDLGKYSAEFQTYLTSQEEACAETQRDRVDHSTAGAQHAVEGLGIIGHIIGYVIAGHHAGLLNGRALDACQEKRLKKNVPSWQHGLSCLPKPAEPALPEFLRTAIGRKDAFSVSFFTRMLFSCLVDADFLDTERFLAPDQAGQRPPGSDLQSLYARLETSIQELEQNAPLGPINQLRQNIRKECQLAAEKPPGFFSLTVPTGGGKTLSSLSFALRHALDHNLRRIIYVVPFTTIIEQNADVFRRHLGDDCVLEHHSNIDPEKESTAARLAAENWNAPVIVTTSVQFYESLFSNRPSRCRKLHRLARSVIILDEAQTIPVEFLQPCLRALRELVENYGCTVVLCTATQPAIIKRPDFTIGISGVREIITDSQGLYQKLKRVEITRVGRQADAEMRERLLGEHQVLCITNTVRHARKLFELLGPEEGHFHLSARMCPAHRRERLAQIRRALDSGSICRLISTQVVEAGVDLDFPVVYRALAGLDSIAQAAGRCNRNGSLPENGRVYVFVPEDPVAKGYFGDTAGCAEQILELYPDPLDLKANEHFFKLYYWEQKDRWDSKDVLSGFQLYKGNREFPFDFSFKKTAKDFRLIGDEATCAVMVPWGEKGKDLCERLRATPAPSRELLRQAQPFIVQIYRRDWEKHAGRSIRPIFDDLGILESLDPYYSEHTGLNLEEEGPGYYFA